MWTFLFLYVLDINFCQAATENSTQMYYARLTTDKNAIGNITEILKPFALNVNNTSLYVEAPVLTTECQNDTARKICFCETQHRWSDNVCRSTPACCGNTECTLANSSVEMCVLNTTVDIRGSLTLPGEPYSNCLTDTNSPGYKICKNDLLEKLKMKYSTLKGFDSLTIIGFRTGSIIADFKMTIVSLISSQELINKSVAMSKNLSASLNMETSGVVRLIMPNMPVPYEDSNTEITCISTEDLKTLPTWSLKNINGQYDITNGTVSTITILEPKKSYVSLKKVTELWAGEYICAYEQNVQDQGYSIKISHKASSKMDVALLPNIDVSTEPSFPRCKTKDDVLEVTANCAITNSSEPYNVVWAGEGTKEPTVIKSAETPVYTVKKIFGCDQNKNNGTVVSCIFTNRLNQTRNSSVPFNIIYANDKFCPADSDWQDTKATFTAVLKCTGSAGQRQRKCNLNGNWEEQQSGCVNSNLYSVLQSAQISDTGLGELVKNAANIFSSLQNVTAKPDTINTFANVNASVEILSTMSTKLKNISNDSTTNDLLGSSSNLLDKSLEKSWTATTLETNLTLAEKYLSSVERLIEISNITNASSKTNIEVNTCSGEQCTNTVFNVNVTVQSSEKGIVKTAGFQYLENYFPNNTYKNYMPNSIVVSTTTQKNNDDISITIFFPLKTPRPRDVKLQCVSWDNNTREWSPNGCVWGGSSKPEECTCSHLSSFAILMSTHPLEIPYMNEITYAGLSVSVVSLVISLLIELIVWRSVVKTNTLYLRHTAHVNISLCLLVADCCFLGSSTQGVTQLWCRIAALLKHFCYLAMFFWMLSLSTTLLHQAIFLFHKVSKKNYLRFSLILGYACPFLIVFVTFLTNNGGEEGVYFNKDTCWLVYTGVLKGSIYTFILPIGIIVFINLFSMVVVILKLLDHKSTVKSKEKDIRAAKTVLRSVILLTPIFGLPWIFGFATFSLDLTAGDVTIVVNYAFVLFNAFQGLFILLTTCLMDKMTRETLLNFLRKKDPAATSDSTTKSETGCKKS